MSENKIWRYNPIGIGCPCHECGNFLPPNGYPYRIGPFNTYCQNATKCLVQIDKETNTYQHILFQPKPIEEMSQYLYSCSAEELDSVIPNCAVERYDFKIKENQHATEQPNGGDIE